MNQGQKGPIPEWPNTRNAHTRKAQFYMCIHTTNYHITDRMLMLFYLYLLSVYFSFRQIAKVSAISILVR